MFINIKAKDRKFFLIEKCIQMQKSDTDNVYY